jgi:hypothetical protein
MLALTTAHCREHTSYMRRAHVPRHANSVNATIDQFATYSGPISTPFPPTQKGHQTNLVAFAFWLPGRDSLRNALWLGGESCLGWAETQGAQAADWASRCQPDCNAPRSRNQLRFGNSDHQFRFPRPRKYHPQLERVEGDS